jgi:histidinol-phosphate phosphatase family protein
MAPKIILLVGFQASTKSSFANHILQSAPNIVILSKDEEKNKTSEYLVQRAEEHLLQGKTVMIDNTNLTIASRKPYIELAKRIHVPIVARYFKTSLEDCQIRHVKRMYDLFGYIPQLGKLTDGSKHPHAFGPGALFAARKALEIPKKEEGFQMVIVDPVSPVSWDPVMHHKKALFLDMDGTVRETEHLPHKYPTKVTEVQLIHSKETMHAVLESYREKGYVLIGVSNQSGISRGILTQEKADAIFEQTRSLLGYSEKEFPIMYCPHPSSPPVCFCRKPQVGMAMEAIMKLGLDPRQCIMVGDYKTDESMAERLQMTYYDVKDFWKIA